MRATVVRDLFSHRRDRVSLGRYTLLHELGRGAMGVVYAAYDDTLDRKVAVKFIHDRQARSEHARARLLREAKAMARISHPAVVAIFDAGQAEGHVFIAMEFIDGQSLSAWCRQAPRPWPELVRMFAAAGHGLAAAHDKGVVHRDFKPGNVLVDAQGRPKVADFGLAGLELPDASDTSDATGRSVSGDDSPAVALTRTGAVLGTPIYMAPEQHRGQPASPRSDQFAFCVALYEALYGRRPFMGDTIEALSAAVLEGRVEPPPARAEVPGWLRAVIVRGLSTEPTKRHPSMAALLGELERTPTRRRRVMLGGAATALLCVGGVASLLSTSPAPCSDVASRLSGTWDPPRREEVIAALGGVDAPYAAETARLVGAALDGYAEAWAAQWHDACAATHVCNEQSEARLDQRMACLDERRRALLAQVSVLAHPDATVLERAVEAVAALPAVERCADPAYVSAAVVQPEPAIEPDVAEQRARLLHVQALRNAGRYDDAAVVMQQLLEPVRALGYEPLAAQVQAEHGAVLSHRGDYAGARRAYWQAYTVADGVRFDEARLEAALGLLMVLGEGLRDPREADIWIPLAQAAWRRLGSPPAAEARLRLHVATLTELTGELDVALLELDEALATLERRDQTSSLEAAALHARKSSVLANRGDYVGAEAELRETARIHALRLGSGHPQIGADHAAVGELLTQQAEPERAHEELLVALAIQQAALGPRHPDVGHTRIALARELQHRGKLDDAQAQLEHARQIVLATVGPDHLEMASVHNELGLLLSEQGKLAEALSELRAGLRVLETLYGSGHGTVVVVRLNIGVTLLRAGQAAEALVELLEVRRLALAVLDAQSPILTKIELGLGRAHEQLGRLDDAEQVYRRALAASEAKREAGESDGEIGVCRAFLGHVLHRRGRDAEALEHVEAALAMVEDGEDDPALTVIARFAWAEVMHALGRDLGRARALAQQARKEVTDPQLQATIDAWLERHG